MILFPTATDDLLGGEKWGLGPTGVLLKQSGPWTYGMLFNHIWDVAGDDDRADINNTFLQPFVSYTTPKAWTFSLQTESTYSWKTENWSVPINFAVSKLTKLGKLPVQYKAGGDVTLGVRWTILRSAGKKLLVMKKSAFTESVQGGDYEALVSAQSRALAAFSREIAEAITYDFSAKP